MPAEFLVVEYSVSISITEYNEKFLNQVISIYNKILKIDADHAKKDLEHHQKSNTSEIFIAREGEDILGVVTMYWQEWNQIGRIGIIAVSEKAQGEGIGKKLVKKVFKYAEINSCFA